MITYNLGEILLMRFPHSDGSGESKRPVVVLADKDLEDIVVSKITSVEKRSKYDITIDNRNRAHFETGEEYYLTLAQSRMVRSKG